jgi:hypothetical protein
LYGFGYVLINKGLTIELVWIGFNRFR